MKSYRLNIAAMTAGAVGLLFALALSGCAYCAQGAHSATPRCIAEKDAIACGMDAVRIFPSLFKYVLVRDWQGLIAEVEKDLPPAAAECVLSIFDPQIRAAYGEKSFDYLAFSQKHQIWRMKVGLVK